MRLWTSQVQCLTKCWGSSVPAGHLGSQLQHCHLSSTQKNVWGTVHEGMAEFVLIYLTQLCCKGKCGCSETRVLQTLINVINVFSKLIAVVYSKQAPNTWRWQGAGLKLWENRVFCPCCGQFPFLMSEEASLVSNPWHRSRKPLELQ